MLEVLRTKVGAAREPVELAEARLRMFRLLLLIAAFLIPAFGILYEFIAPDVTDPLWLRVLIGAFPFTVYFLSYSSRWVQQHFVHLYYTAIYVIMTWFVVISYLNGFSPFYAMGLMFVFMALGLGHGVGLYVMGPLFFFLSFSWVGIAVAIFAAPSPGVDEVNYLCLALSTAVVLYVMQRERFQTRKALIQSEERNRAVLEQTSEGVVLADFRTLRILDANPAFCDLAGRSETDLHTRTLKDLVHDLTDEAFAEWRNKATRYSHFLVEVNLLHDGVEPVPLECSVNRIYYSGQEALCIVARDVSKYKETEAALREANERTEELLRAKTTLLNNVSHELRTPLAGMMGFAEILKEEAEGHHKEFAELIYKDGERLRETLDSVISLAQLEGGMAGSLQLEERDVAKEVEEAVGLLASHAKKKGLSLDVEVKAPAHARLHHVSFQRVLSNLITNAVKFTEEGGITVGVEEDGDKVLVRVSDTGIGIGEAFMPDLFEPFKQESDGLARSYEGVGLGLSICKHLVQQMDGEITVESEKGKGSRFTLAFPRMVAAPVETA